MLRWRPCRFTTYLNLHSHLSAQAEESQAEDAFAVGTSTSVAGASFELLNCPWSVMGRVFSVSEA